MSDDWAKRTFEKLQSKSEAERRDREIEAQRAARISGNAPSLWEFLIEEIKEKVNRLNEQFRLNVPQYADNSRHYLEVKVRSNLEVEIEKAEPPVRRVKLEFDQNVPAIKYTASQYLSHNTEPARSTSRFLFTVRGEQVCMYLEGSNATDTLDQVAEFILNSATGA